MSPGEIVYGNDDTRLMQFVEFRIYKEHNSLLVDSTTCTLEYAALLCLRHTTLCHLDSDAYVCNCTPLLAAIKCRQCGYTELRKHTLNAPHIAAGNDASPPINLLAMHNASAAMRS